VSLAQLAILLLTGGAAWALGEPGEAGRWGYLLALAGQPFWVWECCRARQWGMLAVSLWFTVSWARGAVNHW